MWHISDDGVPRQCEAQQQKCRYGHHFASAEAAAYSYEVLNDEDLFRVHTLVHNTVDDAFADNGDNDIDESGNGVLPEMTWTPEESIVLQRLDDVQAEIDEFKNRVKQGADPRELVELFPALPESRGLVNEAAVRNAWRAKDYDKVKLEYAKAWANKSKKASPKSIRKTPEQFVVEHNNG